jgi:hypothetical protein
VHICSTCINICIRMNLFIFVYIRMYVYSFTFISIYMDMDIQTIPCPCSDPHMTKCSRLQDWMYIYVYIFKHVRVDMSALHRGISISI